MVFRKKRYSSVKGVRNKLLLTLKNQGFIYKKGKLTLKDHSKKGLRRLNKIATHHLIGKNIELIKKYDKFFISKYISNGNEINPSKINPKLIQIDSDDEKSRLFRWVKLHWSIPISAGYGRRLRYLVIDGYNNKLIGIIGLADPVYALQDRDQLIGWNAKTKAKNLRCLMDGFVIGAVPPYSFILGGKLVAALIASNKIAKDFIEKYSGKKALISGKKFKGNLVAVTTSSAFGKSSMYDRIKIPEGPEFLHVGWTKGFGEFHFSNGEYDSLLKIAKKIGYTGKNKKWGDGTRNKRIVVDQALKKLGLSKNLLHHGIKRELFLVPVIKNWKEVLIGKQNKIKRIRNDVRYISSFMLNRWVIPRSNRDEKYMHFKKSSYSLLREVYF